MASPLKSTSWTLAILPSILAIPALLMSLTALTQPWTEASFGKLMHVTGEMSTRTLLLSLFATPLLRLFPTWRWVKWLRRRRRTFGLAAFGYGLLHVIFYLNFRAPEALEDLLKVTYLAGWLAFLIMLPLAITSTHGWMKRLKKRWLRLHQTVYLVPVAIAVHWLLKPDGGTLKPVLVHFVPLILLESYRVIWTLRRSKAAR